MNLRSWLQGTIGITVTTAVLIVSVTYFSVNLATRSHPKPYSSDTARVQDSVLIYRNSFGIPHIIGKNIDDVLFSQGFVHAQDRLWQMDIWRRIGRGHLAEVLGRQAASVDIFMRAIDIEGIAKHQFESLDTTTKHQLESYARGVTKFINEYSESLPFEFDALRYKPSVWTPVDCLIVERVVSFELSLAFWNDVAYARIAAQRGTAAMSDYLSQNVSPPFVLDSIRYERQMQTSAISDSTINELGSLFESMLRNLAEVKSTLGIEGSASGSNCWAVSHGSSGTILANDPHLSVSMPTQWYPNHLTADRFNVIGFSIPGIPFVVSGRNDSIAWGVTNTLADDVDYFVEQIDSTNPNYYYSSSGTRSKFRFRRDTIKVKDEPDSLIDLRFTNRSCVLSDVHSLSRSSERLTIHRKQTSSSASDECLTFRWTGSKASNEIGSLYRINSASTIDEAFEALDNWNTPALNFHFGDVKGNVGTIVGGIVPLRSQTNPLLPIDALRPEQDWSGYIRLSTLGSLRKRDSGYVASANNRTFANTHPFITTLYEPPSRIQRIVQLLNIYRDMSVRDAQVMQLDFVSPYAISVNRRILPILHRASSRLTHLEHSALASLVKWDGTQSTVDPASAIHAVFLQKLMWNTFEDELGTQLFYDWSLVGSNALKRMDELLDDPTHVLFDDIRTSDKEDLSWIVIRSFTQAVNELRMTFESDRVDDWLYGRLHHVTFAHIMGNHPLLEPVINHGPFEVGGSSTTIFNTEWTIYKPYATAVTQSMRIISDMGDSVQYCVVPGGVSGQPLDAHYTDQLQLWLKGGYVRLPTQRQPDVSFRLFQVFYPDI
ncbi:MAG: penicillin acylase family protein [Ignavibacteria bacterium]|nr:penicillin acylase family protein [Ignavibacteria bacterium]